MLSILTLSSKAIGQTDSLSSRGPESTSWYGVGIGFPRLLENAHGVYLCADREWRLPESPLALSFELGIYAHERYHGNSTVEFATLFLEGRIPVYYCSMVGQMGIGVNTYYLPIALIPAAVSIELPLGENFMVSAQVRTFDVRNDVRRSSYLLVGVPLR